MKILFILIIVLSYKLNYAESGTIELNCVFNDLRKEADCKRKLNITIEKRETVQILNFNVSAYSSFEVLKLENFPMFYFPKNFDHFFNKLKTIQIIKTQLKEITKTDLEKFKDLEELTINSNDLTGIETNLLENHLNIKKVDLSYNKIIWVSEEFKEKYKNISTLNGNCLKTSDCSCSTCNERINMIDQKVKNFTESIKCLDDFKKKFEENLMDFDLTKVKEKEPFNGIFNDIGNIKNICLIPVDRNQTNQTFEYGSIIHQMLRKFEENERDSKLFSIIHLAIEILQFLIILYLLYKLKTKNPIVISEQRPQNNYSRESYDLNYDEFPGVIHHGKTDDVYDGIYDEIGKDNNNDNNSEHNTKIDDIEPIPVYATVDKTKKNVK
ncbi:hypothetical protein PVAND_015188 [Polypedilum vanderplanki]|uniref:Leucine rich repeat protein n=1 Tax=Polypedilum vanderplanki TaxID=319348 RepID=A0A9J6BBW9_POLVA|nr:hypothetical protein PVAND_015188 [Polypedilum vanderplanki]